jgi:hypothetical protein
MPVRLRSRKTNSHLFRSQSARREQGPVISSVFEGAAAAHAALVAKTRFVNFFACRRLAKVRRAGRRQREEAMKNPSHPLVLCLKSRPTAVECVVMLAPMIVIFLTAIASLH